VENVDPGEDGEANGVPERIPSDRRDPSATAERALVEL
jgi:hypothetical protein